MTAQIGTVQKIPNSPMPMRAGLQTVGLVARADLVAALVELAPAIGEANAVRIAGELLERSAGPASYVGAALRAAALDAALQSDRWVELRLVAWFGEAGAIFDVLETTYLSGPRA